MTAPLDPLADLLARAGDLGLDAAPLRPVFDRFLEIGRRQAELEGMALGAVPLSFPAHLLLGGAASEPDPLLQGVAVATRERERLGLSPGGTESLERQIGDQGVKVIGVPFPAGSRVLAGFLFDPAIGPAILIDAGATRLERDYALAHEYGHFLIDNDPYRPWVCRSGGGAADSAEELRAHAFAGAFLVPAAPLDAYLEAAGHRRGEPVSADLVRQLRVYFEADDRAILGRLLAGGHLGRTEIAPLMAELGAGAPEAEAAEAPPLAENLSDRYVYLAVMAFRRGALDRASLARYLETDETTAARIEKLFARPEGGNDGHRSD